MRTLCKIVLSLVVCIPVCYGQVEDFNAVRGYVNFSQPLRDWDGFGFNYVETSQTYDYNKNPQDYGGFKFLSEKSKTEIIQLVFGEDGLKPSLVKMFLDPLHQSKAGGRFDHETTTSSMRFFVKEGLKLTRSRGSDFSVITTLYGPPAYITKQKILRGRDLDPAHRRDLALYMINWAKFLKDKEGIPVKYISLHNEGESWLRWPQDGTTGESGHDYNFFWDPAQTIDILKLMRPMLKEEGLADVGLTNGEYTNWYRFYHWGYARAIVEDEHALKDLDLITSHGFYVGDIQAGRWYGPHSNLGTTIVREKKPNIHAWVTSTAWNYFQGSPDRKAIMDAHFVKEIYGNIYEAQVNAIIPWAGIQNHTQWEKPDPNPGCAIRVYNDGTYEVPKAYYFYKQVSRAGQAGMAVAYTEVMDSEFSIIAFAKNNTKHPNALIVTNTGRTDRKIVIKVHGINTKKFQAYATSGIEIYSKQETAGKEALAGYNYQHMGTFETDHKNQLTYVAPAGSVTTFFEN